VILFAASPGTIIGVITLAELLLPVTALVGVAVATVVMWITMLLVGREGDRPGDGFAKMTRRIELVANNAQPFPGRFPRLRLSCVRTAIEGLCSVSLWK
jgi:hypothetical protein